MPKTNWKKNLRGLPEILSKTQGRMSLQMRFEWVVNIRVGCFLLVPYGVWLVPLNNYSCYCPIPGTARLHFIVLRFIELHRCCVFLTN